MSTTNTYIPRRLDDQWKVGLWEMDVAVPWLFIVMLFYSTTGGMLGTLLGVGVASYVGRLISRSKGDHHPAFALHWAYWHLPEFVIKMNCLPPSHYRRMIG